MPVTIKPELYAMYKKTGISNLIYVWLKLKLCPLLKLERYVPTKGRILDLGCGIGILDAIMALSSSQRIIEGNDIAENKIKVARKIAAGKNNLSFYVKSVSNLNQERNYKYDAIVMSDILYLIPISEYKAIFKACLNILKQDGVLIIKEVDTRPHWKHIFTLLQELLAVKILRFTFSEGRRLKIHNSGTLKGMLSEFFPKVRNIPLDKGYPYSHILYICERNSINNV